MGELAAGLAHEIRNPLASIAGPSQMLRESSALRDTKRIEVAALLRAAGRDPLPFPRESMTGALMERITTPGPGRPEPMNANFGLLPEVDVRRKRDRKERKAEIALDAIRNFAADL